MMNLSERLREKMDAAGLSQYSLAATSKVPQPTIHRILTGESADPKTRTIKALADALGCPVDDLRYDKEIAAISSADITSYEIPQYHDIGGAMGDGLVLRDQPGQITGWKVTPEWANKNIPNNTGKENLCIVTGFGDSMRGMFNSGDPLIVDTGVKEIKYDGVYFFRVGDEGFIKRLQRIPGDGIRVISKNQDYETWTIRDDMDFEVFGRVLKVWKSEEF
jgi:transcriptional regulator with XRE-family HTH domain